MMPGQTPYTSSQEKLLEELLHTAIVAEEVIGLDELENYADHLERMKSEDLR